MKFKILQVIIAFIFLICCGSAFAQQHQFSFVVGGYMYDYGNGLATDKEGNIYICGRVDSTIQDAKIDFDFGAGFTTVTTNGGADAFFAKYSQQGKLLWVKTFGGSKNESCSGIKLDDDGNIYLRGNFNSANMDADPGSGNYPLIYSAILGSREDAFVAKYDTSGKIIWAKAFSGNSSEAVTGLNIDDLGNVYITGHSDSYRFDADPSLDSFYLQNTFMSGPSTNRNSQIFIIKLDVNGNFTWAKQINGRSGDLVFGTSELKNNHFYICGALGYGSTPVGRVDFDPGADSAFYLYSNGGIYFAAYDTAGNYLRGYNFGNAATEDNAAFDIATDDSGNVYLTGVYQPFKKADFQPGPDSLFLTGKTADAFLAKYDTTGKINWIHSWGDIHSDNGKKLKLDDFGSIYLLGEFVSTEGTPMDFDPDPTKQALLNSSQTQDVYLAKFSNHGKLYWAQNFGGTCSNCTDRAGDISFDNNNNLVLIGSLAYQTGEVNMGFSGYAPVQPISGYDIVVAKYRLAPMGLEDEEVMERIDLQVFPNPVASQAVNIRSAADIQSVSIYNMLGKCIYFNPNVVGKQIIIKTELSKGMYIIKAETASGSQTVKLLKH